MRLAIIVPTIDGREEHLDRCLRAYAETATDAHVYVEHGYSSCGAAWLAGAARADEDGFTHLHLTADDLEPYDGWLTVAAETTAAGYIPAPLVHNPDGTLDSAGLQGLGQYRGPHEDWQLIEATTVPFLTRAMWEAIGMIDVHYCSDAWVSAVGRRHGWETVIRTGMRFTHHVAQPGRNYGRIPADTAAYFRHLQEVAV